MTLIILFGLLEHGLSVTGNRVQVSMQELLSPLVTDALGAGSRTQLLVAKPWSPIAALAERTASYCVHSASSRASKITSLRAGTKSCENGWLSSFGTVIPDFLAGLTDKFGFGHALLSLISFLNDLLSPFLLSLQEFLFLGIKFSLGQWTTGLFAHWTRITCSRVTSESSFFLNLRAESTRLKNIYFFISLFLLLSFFSTTLSFLAMRSKSLHGLLMNSPKLFLIFMILLFLVSIPLFFILFKGVHLRMQRSHSSLLSSLRPSHHFVVQLSIHLIGLLSLLSSANSFWEQSRNVGASYVWGFCLLINATLIPFRCGFSCARDVKIIFFKFFIVRNELLFRNWSGCLESTRGLTCRW